MNKELKLFLDDAGEQLELMENALINIQDNGVDKEEIDSLFRAMHTIKGTAGMLAFDTIVDFTHIAESLLSDVRNEKIALSEELIEIFFKVKDHVEVLVSLSTDGKEMDEFQKAQNDELVKILKSFMPDTDKNKDDSQDNEEKSPNEDEALWHVSFRLKKDFFSSGMDIISIINFFNEMGSIKKLAIVTSKIPDLKDLDPKRAYIGYEILYLTDISKEDIEEIFEFVIDDIELNIFKADDIRALKELIKEYKDDNLTEKFVKNGFYKQELFDEPKQANPNQKQKIQILPKRVTHLELIRQKSTNS